MASVGEASFDIVADTSGIPAGIQQAAAAAQRAASALGDSAGQALSSSLSKSATAAASSIASSIGQAAPTISSSLRNAAQTAGRAMVDTFKTVAPGAASALSGVVDAARSAWQGIPALASNIADRASRSWGALQTGMMSAALRGLNAVEGPLGRVADVARSAADGATRAMRAGFDRLPPSIQGGLSRAGSAVQTAVTGMGETFRALAPAASAAGKLAGDAFRALGPVFRSVGESIKSGWNSAMTALGDITRRAGAAIVDAAKRIGQGAITAMGDTMRLGASAVGVAVSGILANSLARGFGRLTAIDNAEAKLRGLASTADHVSDIMDAATNAVTGTAFGLDQAATAAAQFAAAQVPIEDMERHLSALANSAAGAGGDFDGMADIFAKVAARGNVTGEVLNQLTSRGVSGLSALADHFDMSTEAVQAMVSAGEVSFDDFSQAMDAAMGRAAIEQATTFQGLMMNVNAAMGRMGATMQRPIFDSLKAVMPGVMQLFNQLEGSIRPIADIIAERLLPAAENFGKMLEKIEFEGFTGGADELFGSLAVLAPVVGGLAAAFAGPLLQSIPVLGTAFSGLTGPVGLLIGALIALFAVKPETLLAGVETVTTKLPEMLEGIVTKVTEMAPVLAERFAANAPVLIQGFADMFAQVAASIGQILPVLIPVAVQAVMTLVTALVNAVPALIQAGLSLLTGLVDGIMAALPVLIAAVPALITALVEALASSLGMILEAGVQILMALVDGIMETLPVLLETVLELLPHLVETILSMLPGILDSAIELFTALVNAVIEVLPVLLKTIFAMLPDILRTVLSMLPQLVKSGIELFLGLVTAILRALPDILTTLFDMLPQFLDTLISMIPDLISTGIEMFLALVIAIAQATPEILGAIIALLPVMLKALVDMIPALIRAGVNLIGGLVKGLWNAAASVGRALLNIAKSALDSFLSFFGIKSPSRLMMGFGENIGEGMVAGIEAQTKNVAKAFDKLSSPVQDIEATVRATPAIGAAAASTLGADGLGAALAASRSMPRVAPVPVLQSPQADARGQDGAFLPGQPVRLTIVDRNGAVTMEMDATIDRKTASGSRGSVRSHLGLRR